MTLFETALIVDRSVVARELFARFLRTHCQRSAAVASIEEARHRCADDAPELVVLDSTLEGGVAWFETWSERAQKPACVVVTSRPTREERARVTLLGAIGYLSKPVAYGQLTNALASPLDSCEGPSARAHSLPLAEIAIDDPRTGERQATCEVTNLSARGAFLAAAAPIATGTLLLLCLVLDGCELHLPARVVRVQEPAWGVVSGWGVSFEYERDSDRRTVARFVEAHAERRSCTPAGASRRRCAGDL